MSSNYFSKQNPTDISIQSEDGGGLVFTNKGKFIFGAKTQAELNELNKTKYQGDLDINPNTNTSFIGIMNDNSEAIPVDVANTNQYSLFLPPNEGEVIFGDTEPSMTPTPTPSFSTLPDTTPLPTPIPTPAVSKTAQEIEEGIYEANFLPASEDDQVTYVYNEDQKLNEDIVRLVGIGKVKLTSINNLNTPIKYNIDANAIGKYVNIAGAGVVGGSNALKDWKEGLINPNVIQDIAIAAQAAGVVATITTAKTGHSTDKDSRHANGTGVDVAIIDGIGSGGATNSTNGNAAFRALGYKLKDALVSMGYVWNSEKGNDKAVLWQTNTGGNHYNHLHISNRIK